jgi:hypothetical protein
MARINLGVGLKAESGLLRAAQLQLDNMLPRTPSRSTHVVLEYRGHTISTSEERGVWRGYVDETLIAATFESSEEAVAWIRRRVDNRIAEAMFPGLAKAVGPSHAGR